MKQNAARHHTVVTNFSPENWLTFWHPIASIATSSPTVFIFYFSLCSLNISQMCFPHHCFQYTSAWILPFTVSNLYSNSAFACSVYLYVSILTVPFSSQPSCALCFYASVQYRTGLPASKKVNRKVSKFLIVLILNTIQSSSSFKSS